MRMMKHPKEEEKKKKKKKTHLFTLLHKLDERDEEPLGVAFKNCFRLLGTGCSRLYPRPSVGAALTACDESSAIPTSTRTSESVEARVRALTRTMLVLRMPRDSIRSY